MSSRPPPWISRIPISIRMCSVRFIARRLKNSRCSLCCSQRGSTQSIRRWQAKQPKAAFISDAFVLRPFWLGVSRWQRTVVVVSWQQIPGMAKVHGWPSAAWRMAIERIGLIRLKFTPALLLRAAFATLFWLCNRPPLRPVRVPYPHSPPCPQPPASIRHWRRLYSTSVKIP